MSEKILLTKKITLIGNDDNILNEHETARVFNTFFSNTVSNLKIPEYTKCDPVFSNISGPIIKSIVKYRNHPSILALGEVCNRTKSLLFQFSGVKKK